MSLMSALPGSGRRCRARFSYVPACNDELKLEVDDVIEILSEVEEGWWKGKLGDKVSVMNINFVRGRGRMVERQTWR